MASIGRREFLTHGALVASTAMIASHAVFADTGTNSRFVLVILRGALDGLSAVPPYGDADYARLRHGIAIGAPGSEGGALKLDGMFGLHPKLAFLSESFAARELMVFHAVASPYRERSHFDGQDILESGHTQPHAVQTGWLNRSLAALPAGRAIRTREQGVAIGQNMPLVMRGPASVASWSPSRLAPIDDDTIERITDLYSHDKLLSQRLADALQANAIANERDSNDAEAPEMPGGPGGGMPARQSVRYAGGGARYEEIAQAAGAFLRQEDGPRVAVFDTAGWDTHANEGDVQGQLGAKLQALDVGLRKLREQLGPAWRETAVMIATEFGRTAAVNGTRGTDHGTGAAAFLLGGAVQGGRVIADWPGLSSAALYQGRDLTPTLDLRAVLKGVLADHLNVPTRALEQTVFPDSAAARPLRDLIRA